MGIKINQKNIFGYSVFPFSYYYDRWDRDISNKEQATVVVRWIEDFGVYEEFLGFYSLLSIDYNSIVSMIKDVLIRINLSINKLRGQCYDERSAMKGHRNGVA